VNKTLYALVMVLAIFVAGCDIQNQHPETDCRAVAAYIKEQQDWDLSYVADNPKPTIKLSDMADKVPPDSYYDAVKSWEQKRYSEWNTYSAGSIPEHELNIAKSLSGTGYGQAYQACLKSETGDL
jgi:hypothetical protein